MRLHDWRRICVYGVVFALPLSLGNATALLSVAAFLLLVESVVDRRVPIKRHPMDKWVIGFALLAAASIAGAPDKAFSVYNYAHLMGRYLLIYYLVRSSITTEGHLKTAFAWIMASALIVVLYGFYQHVHGVDISGMDWVDKEQFPELKTRVFSTLYNPNLLAGFLVTMIAVTGGMALYAEDWRKRLVAVIFIAMLGVCLLMTYSRGAWLSLVAVIACYGFWYNRRVFWLIGLLPIIILVGHSELLVRLQSIMTPSADSSSALRIALWESTLYMIAYNPFLGIGWGSYWLVYPGFDFFIQNEETIIYHAHNMFLNIAAEIGLPGFFCFMYVIYGHLRLAVATMNKRAARYRKGMALGLAAAFVGIAVGGLTDYVMFNIELSMLFWLLSALALVVAEVQ